MKREYINIKAPSEIQISESGSEIWVGHDTSVEINKMFGPTIFADLRITADLERGEWVIERFGFEEFEEHTTIPAQLDTDFDCKSCSEEQATIGDKCKECNSKENE